MPPHKPPSAVQEWHDLYLHGADWASRSESHYDDVVGYTIAQIHVPILLLTPDFGMVDSDSWAHTSMGSSPNGVGRLS